MASSSRSTSSASTLPARLAASSSASPTPATEPTTTRTTRQPQRGPHHLVGAFVPPVRPHRAPVEGTASADSAPTIATGQYLDTIPLNDGLWYKVKRTAENSTVHVGATHTSDGIGNSGTKVSVKTFADPAGVSCNLSMSFPLGRLGSRACPAGRRIRRPTATPPTRCSSTSAGPGAADMTGQPVEIAVYEEPPLAEPSGEVSLPHPTNPRGAPSSRSSRDRRRPGHVHLECPGGRRQHLRLDINPGEAQVLAVPVVSVRTSRPSSTRSSPRRSSPAAGSSPYLQFLGPVRGQGSVTSTVPSPATGRPTPGAWRSPTGRRASAKGPRPRRSDTSTARPPMLT